MARILGMAAVALVAMVTSAHAQWGTGGGIGVGAWVGITGAPGAYRQPYYGGGYGGYAPPPAPYYGGGYGGYGVYPPPRPRPFVYAPMYGRGGYGHHMHGGYGYAHGPRLVRHRQVVVVHRRVPLGPPPAYAPAPAYGPAPAYK